MDLQTLTGIWHNDVEVIARALADAGYDLPDGVQPGTYANATGAIDAITALIASLDTARDHAVTMARRNGASWQAIAIASGTTRQAAWERWHMTDTAPEQ